VSIDVKDLCEDKSGIFKNIDKRAASGVSGPSRGRDPAIVRSGISGSIERSKEELTMSKSITGKLESARKFIEKHAKSDLNIKQAQAALSDAEKLSAEAATLKTKLSEVLERRGRSVTALEQALVRVTLEKKLKAKEAKVQAKLAALGAPPSVS
jgi:hypothetical protein